MERVYLLLRNNQQTGPFTIGELLQQQLKPSDMVWIEGKSTAWTYLSELELVPFVKKADEQKGHEKTVDEIERKAEELRQKILNSSPKTYFPRYTAEIETYASPYKLEDDIQFVDHRKEKKIKRGTVLGELFLTCFVISLFILGIYKGKSFLGARDKVQHSVATQLNSHDQHAAQKNTIVSKPPVSMVDTAKQHDSLLALQKAKQKITVNKRRPVDSLMLSQPVINTAALNRQGKKEDTQPSLQMPPEISIKKEDVQLKKESVSSVPEVKTGNEPVRGEKKGFLRGLFKKKKKDNNKTEE